MYALSIQASSLSDAVSLRRNLSAVYARRCESLRLVARSGDRNAPEAWDAVHDAFLAVLENPPVDVSERSLAAVLERAVRAAVAGQAKQRCDDEALRVALRKRSSV